MSHKTPYDLGHDHEENHKPNESRIHVIWSDINLHSPPHDHEYHSHDHEHPNHDLG